MSNNKSRIDRRTFLGAGASAAAAGMITRAADAAEARTPTARKGREFDVIVIGCGLAGACAAHEAVRAGAKVLVIDNGGAAANASHGTIIYMGGGTALQKACKVEDTPDAMMKYLLASTGPAPDEARVRAYVERSVENFDWLAGLGVPFSTDAGKSLEYSGCEESFPWRETARPAPRGHVPDVPGAAGLLRGGGAWLQRKLLDDARRSGAELLLTATATRLSRDDGVVRGVVVTVDDTEKYFIARRGVVLATGGFAHNRAMVSEHAPDYLRCTPTDLPWNQGWGIRAAQSVGAAVKGMGCAHPSWYFYRPDSRRQGILVNAHGQRFVCEDTHAGKVGDAIVREQQSTAYLIVDSITMQDGPSKMTPDVVAARANTIAEIEQALGIPAPSLQQTVATYNLHAANSQDPFFHKLPQYLRPLSTPPFTAINASVDKGRIMFFTLGGLHTTPASEVLDVEGRPIPHLYAAGRVSAGIPCPYYYTSGLSLGECITFGRIAGTQAATSPSA